MGSSSSLSTTTPTRFKARFLEGCGYPVRGFTNPLEALHAIRERAPSVLVTDEDMPNMTGLELSDEALGEDPDIGIIVVTGVGDEASAQAALRVGAADYLTKPVDLDALERSVQRAAGRRAQEAVRSSDPLLATRRGGAANREDS